MKRFLKIFVLMLLSQSLYAQNPVAFNGSGRTRAEKLAALTIAGIVNREQPRLYLLNTFETWSYSQTDETWKSILENDEDISFTAINSIPQLIDFFRQDLNGGILYDENAYYSNFTGQSFPWQGEFASMLGGLSDRVPVPVGKESEWGITAGENAILFNKEETLQFQMVPNLTLPEWPWNQENAQDRYMEILQWGKTNILPLCNSNGFFIRETTDWSVSQRLFQINLAGNEANSLKFTSLPEVKAAYIESLLTHFRALNPDRIFDIYGWMEPEPLVQWFSLKGGAFHEAMQANLSWFHVFPLPSEIPVRASVPDPQQLTLQRKYYLVFISSEGDAGNWNAGLQGGAWMSPSRGQVPVGWGFNLHFFEKFPYLAHYYHRTATVNDGFVSVISPLGYTYTDVLPSEIMSNSISLSRKRAEENQIDVAYAYKHYNGAGVGPYRDVTISNYYNVEAMADFYEASGIGTTFVFEPTLSTQTAYEKGETVVFNHVNDNTFYGNVTSLTAKRDEILARLKSKQPPYFYLAGYQRFTSEGGFNGNADIKVSELAFLRDMLLQDPEIGEIIEVVTPEKFGLLLDAKLGRNEIPFDDRDLLLSSEYITDKVEAYWKGEELKLVLPSEWGDVRDVQIVDAIGRVFYPVRESAMLEGNLQSMIYQTGFQSSTVYCIRLDTEVGLRTIKYFKER